MAAVEKAEAEKVQVVKAAEADAEAKYLAGQVRFAATLFLPCDSMQGNSLHGFPDPAVDAIWLLKHVNEALFRMIAGKVYCGIHPLKGSYVHRCAGSGQAEAGNCEWAPRQHPQFLERHQ